jgi:hypothetical protein
VKSGPYNEDEQALALLLEYVFDMSGEDYISKEQLEDAGIKLRRVLAARILLSPESLR